MRRKRDYVTAVSGNGVMVLYPAKVWDNMTPGEQTAVVGFYSKGIYEKSLPSNRGKRAASGGHSYGRS